ncbi:MAG: Nicotinate-nucleotide adenylyltransferase [Candidatus Kapaibacterium sp.]|nr:MAG: Nicotinate-nucleotide adenylyltransferase [Candidatus Kapabacteria bacterium]
MNIGIFGGSFNPIHIGHLIIANFFISNFNLDQCYLVPNHKSPFKIEDQEQIADQYRLEMINLAIEGNPKLQVDTYEIKKGGISYSFETVLHFKNKFTSSNLFFLIGTDQAKKFTLWKNWKTILENCYLVVARRDFEPISKDFVPNEFHNSIFFLQNPIIEISSTLIRDLVQNGKSIDYLVPEKVKNYIYRNNLYLKR